ncbi:MAG: hypothetical protein ACP5E3_03130 [Bacteroidales bacterium]
MAENKRPKRAIIRVSNRENPEGTPIKVCGQLLPEDQEIEVSEKIINAIKDATYNTFDENRNKMVTKHRFYLTIVKEPYSPAGRPTVEDVRPLDDDGKPLSKRVREDKEREKRKKKKQEKEIPEELKDFEENPFDE